ncbi:MAG: phospho-sugar mutase [Bacillota bacterium]|nr:phospho-sugar mutase [Bacillota bacterium]
MNHPKETENRICEELTFGTAGIRGKVGEGKDCINRYTIQKATQAFADYLKQRKDDLSLGLTVVIAYDSRLNSKEFAEDTASVFAGNGFLVYLFDSVCPTPELSFAVRNLKAIGGVMITASHNPPEYNGYKVYGHDGCQLVPEESDKISGLYHTVDKIDSIPITHCLDIDIVKYVPVSVHHEYLALIKSVSLRPELFRDSLVKAVYTPLHGVGGSIVKKVFQSVGYEKAVYVDSQFEPDGNFPTISTPNPESVDAYAEGKKYMRRAGADLIIATDPDCDRMGIMLRNGKLLTGNQVAALFLDYILSARKERGQIREGDYVVSSVVSCDLPKKIAESYGVKYIQVLTGFKYIGREIEKDPEHFIMGFEESCGYLFSPEVRDKDGVMASLLALEMSIYRNKNLEHVIRKYHRMFGTYLDVTDSLTFDHVDDIAKKMEIVRHADFDGAVKCDYLFADTGLPKTDLVKFHFAEGGWVAFRPSGTEPKLKVYYCVNAPLQADADKKLQDLRDRVRVLLG